MIATIPKGVFGIEGSPSQGLLAGFGHRNSNKTVANPLNFGGGLNLEPEALKDKLVVLIPALRDFGPRLQASVDLLHQIQKASQSFRVVISTDMSIFKSLRPYGWAITHIQSEGQWKNEEYPWRDYVEDELAAVITSFGVGVIFDFSTEATLQESWNRLLTFIGLSEKIVPSRILENIATKHYSWRGWLPTIVSGTSVHEVHVNEHIQWKVELQKYPGSSMLFVSDDSPNSRELAMRAHQRGWNTALFDMKGKEPEVDEVGLALLHLFDGLSLAGAGVACGFDSDQLRLPELQATIFVEEANKIEFELAELKALAFWSSRH